MAAKLFLVLACLAISHAALVKRDAPSSQNMLQDIADFQKTVTEQFNSLVNSKNTQEMQKAFSDNSQTIVDQLTSFSASLQAAAADASGKTKEALETAQVNVQKTVDDLRKAHPEVEAQAGQLKDKMQAAVQATIQVTQKLVKEVETNVEETNQKLAPKLKQAYDDFVKQTQEVQKKLHEAANKQ